METEKTQRSRSSSAVSAEVETIATNAEIACPSTSTARQGHGAMGGQGTRRQGMHRPDLT